MHFYDFIFLFFMALWLVVIGVQVYLAGTKR